MRLKDFKLVLIIVATAIVFRIAIGIPLFSNNSLMLQHDSPSYLKVAENLRQGNGYSNCPQAPFYKDVLRTPTYPVVLAVVKSVSNSPSIIYLFQLILDLITALMLLRIGTLLYDNQVGFMCGLLYASSMVSVVMVTQVLAETSFVFLLVSSIYFLLCFKSSARFIVAGLFLSFCILCKPIGLYLSFIFLIGIAITYKKDSLFSRFKKLTFFILPVLLLIGGWMIRNHTISGSYTISSISAYSIFAYNANAVLAAKTEKNENVLRAERLEELYSNTEGELADYSGKYDYIPLFRNEGMEIIKRNFLLYVQIHLKTTFTSLLPSVNYVQMLFGKEKEGRNTVSVLHKEGLLHAIKHYFAGRWGLVLILGPWILLWMAMLVFAVKGSLNIILGGDWILAVMLVLPVLYFLLLPGPTAEPRFAAPMVPFLTLLASKELLNIKLIKNWMQSAH